MSISEKFIRGVKGHEGGYNSDNGLGYIGWGQWGEDALRTIGYGEEIDAAGGFSSYKKTFLGNKPLQDATGDKWFSYLSQEISRRGLSKFIGKPLVINGITICPEITEEGALMSAHLGGPGGLQGLLTRGHNPRDDFGTSLSQYMIYGFLINRDVSPDNARDIALRADRSGDYSMLNEYGATGNSQGLIAYYSDEQKFGSFKGAGGGPSYVFSEEGKAMQEAINKDRKARGLPPIKEDGLVGPETYASAVEAGFKDEINKFFPNSKAEELLAASQKMDHRTFKKLNNEEGYADRAKAGSDAIVAKLLGKGINSDKHYASNDKEEEGHLNIKGKKGHAPAFV